MVDTLGTSGKQIVHILDGGGVVPNEEPLCAPRCVNELVSSNIVAVGDDVVVVSEILLVRDSKEEGAAIGLGTILLVGPKMVTARKTLQACAKERDVKVLPQNFPLFLVPVTVTQVGGLSCALMLAEAFHGKPDSANVVEEPILRQDIGGALARDDNVQRLSQAWTSRLVEQGPSALARIIVVNGVSFLSGNTQNERDRAQKREGGKEREAHDTLGGWVLEKKRGAQEGSEGEIGRAHV